MLSSQEWMKVTSPNIWQNLLAFNIGIELGQLLIVVVAFTGIGLMGKIGPAWATGLRRVVAGGAGLVAGYWVIERSVPLWQLVSGPT